MPRHDDFHLVNPDLLRLLPPDAHLIVEVGCSDGALGAQFKRINPSGRYLGIEPDPEAAAGARQRIDLVVSGPVEQVEPADLGIEPGTIDCLVFSNVLEHLADPWSLLRRQASWLRPEGMVLACIPNVQHWALLVRLLQGNWQYEEEGLLDRSYLRFFTLDSIAQMFSQAGMAIFDVQGQHLLGNANEFQQFQTLLGPVVRSLGLDGERFLQQTAVRKYLVRALRSSVPLRRVAMHTLISEPLVCARVRAQEPERFLSTIPGFQATSRDKVAQFPAVAASWEKVCILQRSIITPGPDVQLIQELLRLGYLLIAEMDDDPLRFPLHSEGNFLTFRIVHAVQTSTEPLAEVLRQYNPHVAVFANQLASLPPPRDFTETGTVRLFFGALNREDDWKPILPALNRILQEHGPRLHVQVIFDRPFFEALQTESKSFEPFCAYPRYEALLRACDIGLLPLEPTRFNSMKSDLKWIECAAHGVVALASPTVYEQSIMAGKTGFLYRSVEEFEALLQKLIADRALRQQVARQAYERVRSRRLLSQHYRTRHQWYLQLLDRRPQLTEELRRRTPELA